MKQDNWNNTKYYAWRLSDADQIIFCHNISWRPRFTIFFLPLGLFCSFPSVPSEEKVHIKAAVSANKSITVMVLW